MNASTRDFSPFAEMMTAAGQPEPAIRAFESAWRRLVAGDRGLRPEATLAPADGIPDLTTLGDYAALGKGALGSLAIIRLNGGLGTSMGLDRAKSLLPAREGRAFIEVIMAQVEALRRETGVAVPLVMMDSFRTQADSAPLVDGRPGFVTAQAPVAASFLQHQVPKVDAAELGPAPAGPWPESERWCPPGHGDIFLALLTSGTLDALLDAGVSHAFVANADNLGATPHPAILGWMRARRLPFVMEVCRRTASDSKGGHLARDATSGRLLLREVAQCPAEDLPSFQDIDRHRYFNTNNLWIDLERLAQLARGGDGSLTLPLICNTKHLVPTDRATPRVYQLESAMGAAIEVFEGAAAVCVPRTRFLPVKTTSDLLRLRSDLYEDTDGGGIAPTRGADPTAVTIDLDPAFFGTIDAFEARFAGGAPSLIDARSLKVVGDVRFGRRVRVVGEAVVRAPSGEPLQLPDGLTIGDA